MAYPVIDQSGNVQYVANCCIAECAGLGNYGLRKLSTDEYVAWYKQQISGMTSEQITKFRRAQEYAEMVADR